MNSKRRHVDTPAHKNLPLTCKKYFWSLLYKPLFSMHSLIPSDFTKNTAGKDFTFFYVYFADFMKYVRIICDHDLPVIGGEMSGMSGQGA